MKRIILGSICLLTILFLGSNELQASHTAGGSITYDYVGDSTGIPYQYCITLVLYRREQGANLGTTQPITINSSCFSSQNITLTQPPGVPQGVTPRGDTNCIDYTDPGYASGKILEYTYTGCIVLPGKCSDYTFSWSLCCRNANITNLVAASSNSLYLESKLNNTLGPNDSPYFLNPGAKFFCVGQPFSYSQAATEPDQDSLRFTMAQPWSAANSPINWSPGYSTTQPMTTTTGFVLNPANGLMSFTPSQTEVDVLKLIVEEYRFDTVFLSWFLVGTAIREMQIPVLAQCNPLATTGVSIVQGDNVGGVISKRVTINADSLINRFNVDSIADNFGQPLDVDIIGYNCFDTVLNIRVNGDLKCSSISDDASEFRLIGPDSIARPIIGVEKNCQTTLLTDGFDLYLHKPLDVNGDYLLQIKKGNDGNTIENECGFGVKEFFSMIIRVQNCPILDYKVENVSVSVDQWVNIDWWVDPQFFRPESEKLFDKWQIMRANADDPFFYVIAELNQPSDLTRRSYIDTSLEMYNLDQSHYRYQVQLVMNNDFRKPTNNVRTILLTDTLKGDSTGWNLSWTYYDGWPAPSYEVFQAKVDTTIPNHVWVSIDGPDSNFYSSQFLIPEPLTPSSAGLYVVKVEATDKFNTSNPFYSESNWIYFDLTLDPEIVIPPPPPASTPNVFTPNEDGSNDFFYVNAEGFTNASIEVYNRWGTLVWRNSETKAREAVQALYWNGTDLNSGNVLADGVYYYVITLNDAQTGESENLSGQVNIFTQ